MKKFMIALLLVGSIVSTDLSAMRRKRCSMRGAFKAVFVAALLLLSGNAAAVDHFNDPRLTQAPHGFHDACAKHGAMRNFVTSTGPDYRNLWDGKNGKNKDITTETWLCNYDDFTVEDNPVHAQKILATAPQDVQDECAKPGAIRTVWRKELSRDKDFTVYNKLTCKTVVMKPVKTVTPGRWWWSSDVETVTLEKTTTEQSHNMTEKIPKPGWFDWVPNLF